LVFDMARRIYNPQYNNKGRLVRLNTADRSGPCVVYADVIGKFNSMFEANLKALKELTTQQGGKRNVG